MYRSEGTMKQIRWVLLIFLLASCAHPKSEELAIPIDPAPSSPPIPILTDITPNPAAAGYGQMATVSGQHLLPDWSTKVTLYPIDDPSKAPFECSFVFLGASASEALQVRFHSGYTKNPPPDCPNYIRPAPGLYDLTVTTPEGTSNALPVEISAKPGTPVIRFVNLGPDQRMQEEEDPVFKVGERMLVSAHGIDTAGTKARFDQGAEQIQVSSKRAISSPWQGVGAEFTIPEKLMPGEAQVRIQARGKIENSEWSEPFTFRIVP